MSDLTGSGNTSDIKTFAKDLAFAERNRYNMKNGIHPILQERVEELLSFKRISPYPNYSLILKLY